MPEPTDLELWRGVEHTVRNVLLPAIGDDWARAAAIQLVGLARYAQARTGGAGTGDDGEAVASAGDAARAAELAGVLSGLASNPIVARHPLAAGAAPGEVLAAVGAVLADAADAPDDDAPAREVRAVLRPVVVRQLDDEVAITGPLVGFFRGQLDA